MSTLWGDSPCRCGSGMHQGQRLCSSLVSLSGSCFLESFLVFFMVCVCVCVWVQSGLHTRLGRFQFPREHWGATIRRSGWGCTQGHRWILTSVVYCEVMISHSSPVRWLFHSLSRAVRKSGSRILAVCQNLYTPNGRTLTRTHRHTHARTGTHARIS